MAEKPVRRSRKKADEPSSAPESATPTEATAAPPADADAAPRRTRTPRKARPVASSDDAPAAEPAADAAPADAPEAKPRSRRRRADAPDAAPAETAPADGDAPRPPRRRRPAAEADAEAPREERAPRAERERPRAERARDDDRPRDDRPRDDRPREERSREERPPREERPQAERERPDRPREERPRDDRPRDDREGGRRRNRNKKERRKKDRPRDAQGGAPHGGSQGGGSYGGQQQGGGQHGGYQGGQQGGPDNGHPGTPFEGMLELIGDKKFGFIRGMTPSLIKGDNDAFMPPPLIQKYNLRDGVFLKGVIKPGRKGAWQVTRVDEVMGMDPEEWKGLPDFDEGVTIYPDEKLSLVTGPSDISMRVIDLVAPLGKGQRALIVAPPRAGKTVMLKQIAAGLAQNHPEVKLISLLIDERPEEVTDFRRNTAATVFASSNDYGEDNHIRVATLAFEYARRLVEMGHDVVILLDSLTRLGRTFNLWGGNSGRTMSGGLDARALVIPRKIFGAARNIEHGGSLTIIATALVETGSRMDEVIFEEFKGTGNAEIVLDRELADKRIYPAINVRKSGTRNEERLMPEDVMRQRHVLFRVLNARHPVEAMQALVRQVQLSPTNLHLLNELIPEQTY